MTLPKRAKTKKMQKAHRYIQLAFLRPTESGVEAHKKYCLLQRNCVYDCRNNATERERRDTEKCCHCAIKEELNSALY